MRYLFLSSLAGLAIVATIARASAAEKQVAATAAAARNFGYLVPTEVDPQSKSQRVLVLLPGGPLLVELLLTIDGQPFQKHREQMIDDDLRAADADGDGIVTWDEFLARPGIAGGRLAYLSASDEANRMRAITQYDQNRNGVVDRYELRGLIAQTTGGPAFLLQNFGYSQQNPAVRELLDVNKDNILDGEEIAAAAARLKSRDANDNDIVDIAELTGNPYAAYGVQQGRTGMAQPAGLLYQVQSGADWKGMFDALQKRYAKEGQLTAESVPATPELVAKLDENKNQMLDKDELAGLLGVAPHLVYEVNLGESGELPGGRLKPGAASQAEVSQVINDKDSVFLELPGVRLQFAYANPKPNYGNLDAYVSSMLTTYDKDKNGYLEKKEFEGQQPQLVAQFATWDLDSDGKVFPEEMKKSFEKGQAPTWNRVTVTAADLGDSLYSLLDTDNDHRLSLRELNRAADRIKSADKNGDGCLSPDEVPGTIRLNVSRGNAIAGGQFVQVGGGRFAPANQKVQLAGPEWFVRMDTNGDGDVTLREFLGDAEQFHQLDANHDGFIDAPEAAAAK